MLLQNELSRLESAFQHADSFAPEVSSKGVDWHLAHTLRSLIVMAQATIDSDPKDYSRSFNLRRFVIFNLGKIPRGKAKAPKVVLPPDDINMEIVRNQLDEAKEILIKLENVEKNKFFPHPFFGKLNKKQAIRIIELHTRHHLNIMDDIIKRAND
jgi:hypothetical protein